MASNNIISCEKLSRLIGRPDCPYIIDVRTEDDFATDQHLIPSSLRRSHTNVQDWAHEFENKNIVVVCQKGLKLSEGVAAWLRCQNMNAVLLEGGTLAWANLSLPMIPECKIPQRHSQGQTLWVTRARPKIDRIACPWLIRRFVDPKAMFLFVSPSEVMAVAERFQATPFDMEGENIFWSHRGSLCTFDVMVHEFEIKTKPLLHLARIVRGADTSCLNLEPECHGLLAASLGLSRMYSDDLQQLEAGIGLYDAFYRWCRDATDEVHHWPVRKLQK